MRTRSSSRGIHALAGLVLAGALGCGHHVNNGDYDFAATSIDKDTCLLAPGDGGLWGGGLTTTGEQVSVDYALAGQPNAIRLVGHFKAPQYSRDDGFLVDGTAADLTMVAPGASCIADAIRLHVDADIQDPDHYTGLVHVTYELTPPPDANDPCHAYTGCELVGRFTAVRK